MSITRREVARRAAATRPANRAPIPLLYLLAASHSGSTLLAMLLGSHPDLRTVGELKMTSLGDVDTYRCSCGELVRRCAFWRSVGAAMQARGVPFDIGSAGTDLRAGATELQLRLLRPLHRGPVLEAARDLALRLAPGWRQHLARVKATNAALVGAIQECTGAKVIVDSSKVGIRLKYLLRNPAFDVKVVRLVRDGRAVALTYMDPERFADAADPRLRGGGSGASRDGERLSIAGAAHEWRRSNEEGLAIVGALQRDRWIEVRYEGLCARPAETLERICSFVGVPSADVVGSFRSVVQHVIGNGMRLDTTIEIRLDDRWKTVLAAADLDAFDQVAGDLNRRFGY